MKKRKLIAVLLAVTGTIYTLLLVPEKDISHEVSEPAVSEKQPFVWNRDDYWKSLEASFKAVQQSGCQSIEPAVTSQMRAATLLLKQIADKNLPPEAAEFSNLEKKMFDLGPKVAGCNTSTEAYYQFIREIRRVVKNQSREWDMNSDAARSTLYRLLYGGRTAVEEIITQVPAGTLPALMKDINEASQTPSAEIQGLRVRSGDILVSRGGAPTSALIARGNDYPGNFSHIAFVYVDPQKHEAKIVESHIERGVVISTVKQYLEDKKLRVMLLRPRADLPQIRKDPMLPHKAAELAYNRAKARHIPYDFAMNYKDHSKLFCSEVASAAYEQFGVRLWAGISHISSPGLRKWLSAFGVRHFETQEPSDLEYDPQLVVVGEWRDQDTLKQARYDNAVTEVMLEGAEKGDEISHQWYLLPFARIVKGYSAVMNLFGRVGPVPEGMSATTALRTQYYDKQHEKIKNQLSIKAGQFRKENGYEPPYWELVKLARTAKEETE